jgi:hypothetical protein
LWHGDIHLELAWGNESREQHLGIDEHSSVGLMRPRWDKADWQRVAAAHIPIAPADAVRMKASPLMADTVARGR